jgi:methionyl aminopeptidase
MIHPKTKEEIAILREGGRRLASILTALAKMVEPGMSAAKLDEFAYKEILKGGDRPAFLNYRSRKNEKPFPSSLCVSVNSEIVHGPAFKDKILKTGDIVSLDLGLIHKDLFTDSAITVPVGEIDDESKKLINCAKEALFVGIKVAKVGSTTGDIGNAIENYIKQFGYGIVRELSGHGVGYKVHEEPYVPNYGKAGEGELLLPGSVIAIEPMVNLGSEKISLAEDGFTYVTKDGKRSAHFEHTIAITKEGTEILTSL